MLHPISTYPRGTGILPVIHGLEAHATLPPRFSPNFPRSEF
jgi:hypothetical protein